MSAVQLRLYFCRVQPSYVGFVWFISRAFSTSLSANVGTDGVSVIMKHGCVRALELVITPVGASRNLGLFVRRDV